MVPYLPQNDPNRPQRDAALNQQRQSYRYNRTKLAGLAMADTVPGKDQSFGKFQWIQTAVSLLLRVSMNQRLQDINERGVQLFAAIRLLSSIWLYNLLNDPRKAGFLKRLLTRIQFWVQRLLRKRDNPKKSSAGSPEAAPQKRAASKNAIEGLEAELEEDTKFIARCVTELATLITAKHAHDVDTAFSAEQGDSLQDYKEYFRPYNDLFQLIYLPAINNRFYDDEAFAAQRVAGPNPLVIEKIAQPPANFPVTDTHYQGVMGQVDSLEKAGAEGRLYLADYNILAGVKTGTVEGKAKYLCAPLALFAVPAGDGKRALQPVAIQCDQQPGLPIFTPPPTGTPQPKKWAWLMAKTVVQIADGNYHELISHLGRTHLLIEAFVLATYQRLAPNHPINLLLTPHFEGTLFINELALRGLINPGGTVDKVLGGTLDESLRLTAEGVKGYPFSVNDSMVPTTFAKRGVDDNSQLPDYPYRDDALLIWQAIHQWVGAYVGLYYGSDGDVCQDPELQNWLGDLLDPNKGGLAGVGETVPGQEKPGLYTCAYLIDLLTLVIFTGSAQHAAVNFPQADYMTSALNMPLAGYGPGPTSVDATVKDYFALLPTLEQAEVQMNMTYPLGNVYYTRLGEYKKDYFGDDRVKAHLMAFQQRLKEIEVTIDDRNAKRPHAYNYLHPANIPQSINI